jgi:cell division protein FtsZ
LYVASKNLPLELAFRMADDVLRQAVQGISELITQPGMINVDFAHIKRLMKLGGGALMSIGHGQGNHKTEQAVDQALNHPLLESVSLENAAGMIVNFSGGPDMTLMEVQEALTNLQSQASSQTEIVMGVINNPQLKGRVQVTLIITGLGAPTLEEAFSGVSRLRTIVEAPAAHTDQLVDNTPELAAIESSAQISPIHSNDFTAVTTSADIDIPAFLRRRKSYIG